MKRYALFFLFFFFFFLVEVAHGDDSQTTHALATLLPQWNKTTNQSPCTWRGVTCANTTSSELHVTRLSLSGLGLSAAPTFFSLLCQLTSLDSLDLSSNSFSSIPTAFFSNCSGLSHLKLLNLSYNSLAGPLVSFSTFPALETLDLSSNQLQGPVGPQLDGLIHLKSLNLSKNFFTGTIPIHDGLHELVLSLNELTGNIPNATLKLQNLTLLDLSANSLSGPIPDGIGELSKLRRLSLSANNLTGEIPGSLASIATLQSFAANQNGFVGTIPSGITDHVKVLDLSYNRLSGQIPPDLLSPPTLLSVDLSHNLLEGAIPTNISSRLYRLRVSGNSLNGTIPAAIGSSNVTYLELDSNELEGEIPLELGSCRNLMLLNLARNRLRAGLPKELGNLSSMVIIYLQENTLSGEIPKEILKLENLITLNVSHNLLSGTIPSEISGLEKLTRLNLEGNRLIGTVPNTISALSSLIELQLGNNMLTGSVPRMPNSLSVALNLSSNLLTGPIPSYLGDLQQLEILDLSNNEFTGNVPSSLTAMLSLTQLTISNNQLSGTLPAFREFVHVAAGGNKNLVIQAAVSPGTQSTKKKSKALVVIVAVIGSLIGLGLVSALLLLCISNRFYRVEDVDVQLEESPPQIISGRFITSNSIHKSNIDFTKAMEAVGNPSNITLKTRFSTYYEAEMPSGVSYTVKKLNWSEKIFEMGSHERFGQELEVLGRLTNSNVMVPLAYVLTEDNAYLFYESVHMGTLFDFLHKGVEYALDWRSRYSIALGVAQGLSFLHGCIQPVLLLDLSTKSIHLKSTKEPQIGDIELCKVMDPSKSNGRISTVAGSVGYIPPEYAYTMRVTVAGNVYSFGVILLELLTGKPPVNQGIELAKWASSSSGTLDPEQILDSSICGTSFAVRSQMLSVLKVALSCVSSSPEARPNMRNVYSTLINAK